MPNIKKKFIIFGTMLAFLLLFLTACGKSSSKEEGTTEDPTVGFTAKKDYVVTTANDTIVYRTPDFDGEKYDVLKTGVNLRRTGVKDNWTRIRLNDTVLYVETSKVKETQMEWATEQEEQVNSHVVFIDPGKQIYAMSATETLFPNDTAEGAKKKKKMTKGAVGVASGIFEYEVTLDVAEKLKHELELRGYTVFLSRASHTASISNGERAVAGNQSGAEIMIRLSAQATENPETKGILGFVTSAENPGTGKNYENSFYLANSLLTEMCSATEVNRIGIFQTDELVFLNYAEKPAVSVQLGFLSNAEEDQKLSDEEYRKLLARGLANGVDTYFSYVDGKAKGNQP